MKIYMVMASVAFCLSASVNAQNYDSTGTNRLSFPAAADNSFVDVPGYGKLAEGAVIGSYKRDTSAGNTCFNSFEYGICVVRKGAGGYSGTEWGVWKQFCPANSYNIITGSSGGDNICGGD
ncbi:hypothetical protein V8Z74_15105 [Comamonas sp. w2-DMI]|uniref:hypothetical protein n=1 Tax=Comamonas sp. w2-DMI TaxID=3126391 RepID=UPI0032E37237